VIARGDPGRSWPLTVLAVLLILWEPATFALYASSVVDRIAGRGPAAVLLLAARVVVLGIGISAGIALWSRRTGALALARIAIALAAIVFVGSWFSRALPVTRPPGQDRGILVLVLAYYAAWFAYLTIVSRRPVRERDKQADE
jgi:hypothetical protein